MNDNHIVGDVLRRVVEKEPKGCGYPKLEMVTIMIVMMKNHDGNVEKS